MSSRLASAPVSWGVWERAIGRDDLVPPARLLEAVRSLGYGAIELGPLGYFGADGSSVRAALEPFELELVGAFVPLHLTEEAAFRSDLTELDRAIEILAAADGDGVVLLADAGSPERRLAAGRPEELRRTSLSGAALERAAGRVSHAAERCRERGLAVALHPEATGYVEAPTEIEAFLERTEPELLGLCLDTGHALVGDGDPVELARDWAERLVHLHLKDVDGGVLTRLRAGALGADAAWEEGLFCPLGEGEVDLAGVLGELHGYRGFVVLEQDRVAVGPGDLEAVRAVEERNLALVAGLLEGSAAR